MSSRGHGDDALRSLHYTDIGDRDLLVMSLRDRDKDTEIKPVLFDGTNQQQVSKCIVLFLDRVGITTMLTMEARSKQMVTLFDSLVDNQDTMWLGASAQQHAAPRSRGVPSPTVSVVKKEPLSFQMKEEGGGDAYYDVRSFDIDPRESLSSA